MKNSNAIDKVKQGGSFQKSTHKAEDAEKAPTRHHRKAPTRQNKKTPSNYVPSGLRAVLSEEPLNDLLAKHSQNEWQTTVRVLGLLLLIDFVLRKGPVKGVAIAADLADQYVSKIGRRKSPQTIREPLPLLRHIGVLKLLRPAVNGRHLKTAGVYAIHESHAKKPFNLPVKLPPCLAKKREFARDRCERRLNRRHPCRAQLLVDLRKLTFDVKARFLMVGLARDPKFGPSTTQTVNAIDGQEHSVKISPLGQITTSIGSCPRDLKPFLLLDGKSTVSCDVSHAHHCFLPRILHDRIAYIHEKYGEAAETVDHEAELQRLFTFLSDGDYYRKWCANPNDDAERAKTKLLVNMLLNFPNAKCSGIGLYKRMLRKFPITFKIIEDIKRADHRNISKQTQHFTAKAINDALLEVQGKGIAGIPDVDAIICQKYHRKIVCEAIGRKIYAVSGGVCCKVDGIRYECRQVG